MITKCQHLSNLNRKGCLQIAIAKRYLSGFPAVDGMYSVTQKSSKQNLAYDLNKNSKLRAIFITVDVLCGSIDKVDAKLKSSRIMGNEFGSNKSSSSTSTSSSSNKSTSSANNVYDQSKEIEGVHNITSKYLKKLSQKLGGRSLESNESEARGRGGGSNSNSYSKNTTSNKGDGNLLHVGRKLMSSSDENKVGGWMLESGMGDLLQYCLHRTIKIGKYCT